MGERCQHRNVRNPSFSGCYEPQTREYLSLQIIFYMMMTEESPPPEQTLIVRWLGTVKASVTKGR